MVEPLILPELKLSLKLRTEFAFGLERLVTYAHCLLLPKIESVWASYKSRAILHRISQSNINLQSSHEFQFTITSHVLITTDTAYENIASGFINGAVALYQLTRSDPGPMQLRWLNNDGKISVSPVASLAWTPSRPSYLYVAHTQGLIAVYDLRLGQECPMRILNSDVSIDSRPSIRQRLIPRREKKRIMSVSEVETADFRIFVRPPETEHNPVQCIALPSDPLSLIKFAPSSNLLGIAQESGLLVALDLQKDRAPLTVAIFHTGFGAVLSIAWHQTSDEGRFLLAAASQDDCIALYDVYSGSCIARCREHRSWPTSLAFISQPEAVLLVSVSEDCYAIIWRLCKGTKLHAGVDTLHPAIEMCKNVKVDNDPIASLSVCNFSQETLLCTISRSGRVKVWDIIAIKD